MDKVAIAMVSNPRLMPCKVYLGREVMRGSNHRCRHVVTGPEYLTTNCNAIVRHVQRIIAERCGIVAPARVGHTFAIPKSPSLMVRCCGPDNMMFCDFRSRCSTLQLCTYLSHQPCTQPRVTSESHSAVIAHTVVLESHDNLDVEFPHLAFVKQRALR